MDVFPEIEINETPIAEIDVERLGNELIDSEGEITVKIDFAPNATVYACDECNMQVTAEGIPAGPYEGDVQAEQCRQHDDYVENSEDPFPHVPTVAPLGWLQSVKVQTDTDDDSVTLTVWVDGHALIMTVEARNPTGNDPQYWLRVPHPDATGRSAKLTPLAVAGLYRIDDRQA